MICQHDEITRCHLKCFIGIAGNSFIFIQKTIFNSFIFYTIFFYNLCETALTSTSICKAELPIRISLCLYRFYHFPQIFFFCLVQRNCNGETWTIFKYFLSLSSQFFFLHTIFFQKILVISIISLTT